MKISLNADMGESFGRYKIGDDDSLMPLIGSANIACGMHAGDPAVMTRTISLALECGVRIGAHPGFDDREGFGRRRIAMNPSDIEYLVTYQIGALQAIANGQDATVEYVKPHGALNNISHEERDVAMAVARGVRAASRDLIFVANCLSQMTLAAEEVGLQVAHEAYADRRYCADGRMLPRSHPQAVIRDPAVACAHVLTMAEDKCLVAIDGTKLPTKIDTFCIHADEPTAVEVAKKIHDVASKAGGGIISFLDKMT